MLIPTCLALLVIVAACSVKEDRSACPCYLQVSFSDPDANGEVDIMGWRDSQLFRERICIEENRPYWTKPVDKKILTLSAYTGLVKASAEGRFIRIPTGFEADSLYAWFEDVDATGDIAYAKVSFRKQFATVFLDIRKEAEVVRDCRFLVEGNSCGFDLLDFSPIEGMFRFEPLLREGDNIVSFRLPRQADTALSVTIQPTGSSPAHFPVGEYIARLGYSWKTEELQDIYVSIDLTRNLIKVRIADWEEGATFQIVEQ